ncbi:cell division control protein 6 homolog isoform X2 [Elaeis guineensis]|uniref:cell division control protein 6 homolog isoform X2 n=1 Tax=Elaeis guineensis var. tenera TaxID=51953 RepID=UPI003C6D5737
MAKTRSANCGPECLNRSPDSEAVVETTENRKRSRSQFPDESLIKTRSPAKWRSPRGCTGKLLCSPKSPRKRLSDQFSQRPKWNPRDPSQMQAVKEALHVATAPTNVACRKDEQKRILEFCKACIEQEKAGSLYVCGSPGTGKSLSVDKVKDLLAVRSKEVGFQSLDTLAINCTSLTNTSKIFSKILEKFHYCKKTSDGFSPLQHLQNLFSHKKQPSSGKMMLIIVDEMDYLITKDCAVLHNLFMLTTFPFSRCILIGIANAINLADRFLPKLESLNCKPVVITFHAYSKDQILKILHHRLMVLQFDVFQPLALEFCARKVAAASGDMRKALGVCRSAVEVLEAQLRDATRNQDTDIIILCSLVKLFRQCKKNATTLGDLNKAYSETCKSSQIPAVGTLEFTNMCKVLSDQGLLKLGQSREDKLKRVTLQIDSSDITFAFKGNRFFSNLPGVAMI